MGGVVTRYCATRDEVVNSKRVFDIIFAAIGIAVFAPAMLLIAIFILWDSGPPVVFTQERIGARLRQFRVYKFRSMHDGLVTRPGRWIRATGLDEVLQFFNVLRGEMSMVGPRPLTGEDLNRLGWVDNPVRRMLKPGVTGLAQLYAGRGARQSGFLDSKYARQQSICLDFKIISVSFAANVFGKRRVRQWLRSRRRRTG